MTLAEEQDLISRPTVSLVYQEPGGFNPDVPFGNETISTHYREAIARVFTRIPQGSLLNHNGGGQNGQVDSSSKGSDELERKIAEYQEDLKRKIAEYQEDLKRKLEEATKREKERQSKLEADVLRGMKEIQDDMGALGKKVQNDMAEIVGKYRQTSERLDKIADILTIKEGRLLEHFNHTYNPGERNSITYNDFFREYANAIFFIQPMPQDVVAINRKNSRVEGIMDVEVVFGLDGGIQYGQIVMWPEFIDEVSRTETFYRELLKRLQEKPFIPPIAAGLTAPYTAEYTIVNRYMGAGAQSEKEKGATFK